MRDAETTIKQESVIMIGILMQDEKEGFLVKVDELDELDEVAAINRIMHSWSNLLKNLHVQTLAEREIRGELFKDIAEGYTKTAKLADSYRIGHKKYYDQYGCSRDNVLRVAAEDKMKVFRDKASEYQDKSVGSSRAGELKSEIKQAETECNRLIKHARVEEIKNALLVLDQAVVFSKRYLDPKTYTDDTYTTTYITLLEYQPRYLHNTRTLLLCNLTLEQCRSLHLSSDDKRLVEQRLSREIKQCSTLESLVSQWQFMIGLPIVSHQRYPTFDKFFSKHYSSLKCNLIIEFQQKALEILMNNYLNSSELYKSEKDILDNTIFCILHTTQGVPAQYHKKFKDWIEKGQKTDIEIPLQLYTAAIT